MKKLLAIALLTLTVLPAYSTAEEVTPIDSTVEVTTTSENPELTTVKAFYDLLSNKDVDAAAMKEHASTVVAANWKVIPGVAADQGLEGFSQTFSRYHQAIPDMKWTIAQIIRKGHTYVVRCEGTGVPVFDFLGLGDKFIKGNSFKIMTIDIHTVRNNKIIKTYHVEDWQTAMQQLSTPVTP